MEEGRVRMWKDRRGGGEGGFGCWSGKECLERRAG